MDDDDDVLSPNVEEIGNHEVETRASSSTTSTDSRPIPPREKERPKVKATKRKAHDIYENSELSEALSKLGGHCKKRRRRIRYVWKAYRQPTTAVAARPSA